MNAPGSHHMLIAGTSRVDITPAGPVSMGGYGQRAGLVSQGVHDHLFAKGLYLAYAGTRLLFITTDLISIPNSIYQRVLDGLQASGVVDPAGLCLTASHTHSGPDVDDSLIIASPTRAYTNQLVESLVQVGQQAAERAVPAQIKMATGEVDFLVNRRQMGRDNLVDRRVLAVQVDDASSGRRLAVLFGVGCHPVCLGHDNLLISADYPGVAQTCLEARLGVENALFVNLTEGNVIPDCRPLYDSLDTRGYLGGAFEDAHQTGTALALEVVRCLEQAAYQPLYRLGARQRTVTVRPAHWEVGMLSAWKQMAAQRKIILEYLPEFRQASILNLKPVLRLWRDASAVVVKRDMSESEMRRLMAAVSTFLVMAMKLTNPTFRKPVAFPVQAIELNNYRFMTLPGEVLVEVGRLWQERCTPPGGQAFVIGLANGFLGYLPDTSNFQEDGAAFKYETIMNALEQQATRLAVEQAGQMVCE